MSASAKIINIDKPVKLQLECYACGKPIDLNDPSYNHEACWDKDLNERKIMKVNFDFENLEY